MKIGPSRPAANRIDGILLLFRLLCNPNSDKMLKSTKIEFVVAEFQLVWVVQGGVVSGMQSVGLVDEI